MNTRSDNRRATDIVGLQYIPNFIDDATHDELVRAINLHPWEQAGRMRRVTQQYGFAYNYGTQQQRPQRIEPFPPWLDAMATRLHKEKRFDRKPDQAIVNRYLPGEGIGSHVDFTTHFGRTVASLSLLSDVVMDFTRIGDVSQTIPLLLERSSAVILSGEARYRWKHGIAQRKVDTHQGRTIDRGTRYSITFRTML